MGVHPSYLNAAQFLFSKAEITAYDRLIGIAGVAGFHLLASLKVTSLNLLFERNVRYPFILVNACIAATAGYYLSKAPNSLLAGDLPEAVAVWRTSFSIIQSVALFQLSYWVVSSRRTLRVHEA